jgi:hypothetical protein
VRDLLMVRHFPIDVRLVERGAVERLQMSEALGRELTGVVPGGADRTGSHVRVKRVNVISKRASRPTSRPKTRPDVNPSRHTDTTA